MTNTIMNLHITASYASFLAILFLALSLKTIRERRRSKVAIGSGGDPILARAVRAHANFSEYVPLALLLMAFVEINQGDLGALHTAGVALCLGRLSHGLGISREEEDFRFRIGGMAATFMAYFILIIANLYAILS